MRCSYSGDGLLCRILRGFHYFCRRFFAGQVVYVPWLRLVLIRYQFYSGDGPFKPPASGFPILRQVRFRGRGVRVP